MLRHIKVVDIRYLFLYVLHILESLRIYKASNFNIMYGKTVMLCDLFLYNIQ